MASNMFCDGVRRRDFIKVGAIGGLGLNLAGYLRLAEARQVDPTKTRSAVCITLYGGPSHQDTFDLKPDGPSEVRGEFKPIKTNVPGIEICEHMPKLARCADKYTIIRSVSHTLGSHFLGMDYLNTGNRPLPSLDFPSYSAVVSREMSPMKGLPTAVAIPSTYERPGYLGIQYAALETGAAPTLGKPFSVRGISIAKGLTVSELERRHHLLNDLDTAFKGYERSNEVLEGLDKFDHQAYDIISSSKARTAFDTSLEQRSIAEEFGNHPFGQSCLLATRLVEAGVRFVEVTLSGWDTHIQNFKALKTKLMPQLDDGLAALFSGLAQRGLLNSTSVLVKGEFGRTPKINAAVGRDHWPQAMFALMSGGGMKVGQVIGATDKSAARPTTRPISPDDIAASFYKSLGIDHTKEYRTPAGRPVMIVRNGNPVEELFG
jgi:uncharacterized protein (DUF1501 family)